MGARSQSGDTFIKASLEDKGVIKGLRGIQRRMTAVGESLTRVGAMGTAAGAAIGGAFAGLAKQFAASGDALDKMAQRTGFSVESLSALKFATEQSGQSAEQMEAVLIGMTRQVRGLERGLSTAKEAFGDLGISYGQIKNLKPEEQFLLIADKLSEVEDPTRRAGIAMQVFGRAGRNLIPLLSQGREGIGALTAEAEKLGIVMSTEDATAAAMLTDSLNRVWSQVKAMSDQIGAAIAGPLTEFLDWVSGMLPQFIEWIKENDKLIVGAALAAAGVAAVGTAVTTMGAAMIATSVALNGMTTALAIAKAGVLALNVAIKILTVTNPILLVVTAIVGALVWLGAEMGIFDDFIALLKAGASAVMGGIKVAFNWFVGKLKEIFKWLGKVAESFGLTFSSDNVDKMKGPLPEPQKGPQTPGAPESLPPPPPEASAPEVKPPKPTIDLGSVAGQAMGDLKDYFLTGKRPGAQESNVGKAGEFLGGLLGKGSNLLGEGVADVVDGLKETIQQQAKPLEMATANASARASSSGAFSAGALRGLLSGGNAQDRTAKATEKTVKVLERMERKGGGLVTGE